MIQLAEKKITNTKLLDALRCCNEGRPPIWLMRQAGRYLPEYRALRVKHPFMTMCRTPELAAEVTLQPITRYGFDAAIIFSDILVIADVLDLGLRFEDKVGPVIEKKIDHPSLLATLPTNSDVGALKYVAEAIQIAKSELSIPLIGFAGAPFTVASYFIEGGTSKQMRKTKTWMFSDPSTFHSLLDKITQITIDYLNMQIDAGVTAVQIFDSWASILAYPQFAEFSLAYIRKIIEGIKDKTVPVIVFCKGSSPFLPGLISLEPSCISLDWNINLETVRDVVPAHIAIQGNLDPDVLFAPFPEIEKETKRILNQMRNDKGYIFNLGHGIQPDMSLDAIKTLVDTVKG